MQALTTTIVEEGDALFVELEVSTRAMPVIAKDDEVLVRIEAAPINPSDLGLMLPAGTDMSKAKSVSATKLRAPLFVQNKNVVKGRFGKKLLVGNESAGVVVAAGKSKEAQQLVGKTVALLRGEMFAEYRVMSWRDCLVLNANTTAREGASCFVNPLTVLGFLNTMREEKFTAIVHTAAASQLGMMLIRICAKENIPLINIVRNEEQKQMLKTKVGAKYVVSSADPAFKAELTKMIAETKAYLCFDAIGGGKVASEVLTCMELAASSSSNAPYSIYGSNEKKKVYIYGGLDFGPTVLTRNFGFLWSVEGWLLTPTFLQRLTPVQLQQQKQKVADEVKTTFKTEYSNVISLNQVVDADVARQYFARKTGEKFLIDPSMKTHAAKL